ncbi:hypothetical protein [Pseudomonas sp. BF-RE-29]|uniref:hypothetical protein n=1 Tax=Pseudomonas sp. BF-RE-29 TaxID=2832378 RepID=UPI00295875A8|nr:hypothetical protein [Pseudomonas sp. BF-RE-29]
MPEEIVVIQPKSFAMSTACSGTLRSLHWRNATEQKQAVDRRSGPDRRNGQLRIRRRHNRGSLQRIRQPWLQLLEAKKNEDEGWFGLTINETDDRPVFWWVRREVAPLNAITVGCWGANIPFI